MFGRMWGKREPFYTGGEKVNFGAAAMENSVDVLQIIKNTTTV